MPTHTHPTRWEKVKRALIRFGSVALNTKWHLWWERPRTSPPNFILFVNVRYVNGKSRSVNNTQIKPTKKITSPRMGDCHSFVLQRQKSNVYRVAWHSSFAETSKSQRKFDLLAFNGNCEHTNIARCHKNCQRTEYNKRRIHYSIFFLRYKFVKGRERKGWAKEEEKKREELSVTLLPVWRACMCASQIGSRSFHFADVCFCIPTMATVDVIGYDACG